MAISFFFFFKAEGRIFLAQNLNADQVGEGVLAFYIRSTADRSNSHQA